MNSFRLKTQDIELEISGERDFVENQLALWFGESEPLERVSPDFTPRSISFEEFLKLKEPRTSVEKLLSAAYYLEKYSRKEAYTLEELAFAIPVEPETMEEAIQGGWLESNGQDTFTLTFSGEQYVQGGF